MITSGLKTFKREVKKKQIFQNKKKFKKIIREKKSPSVVFNFVIKT